MADPSSVIGEMLSCSEFEYCRPAPSVPAQPRLSPSPVSKAILFFFFANWWRVRYEVLRFEQRRPQVRRHHCDFSDCMYWRSDRGCGL